MSSKNQTTTYKPSANHSALIVYLIAYLIALAALIIWVENIHNQNLFWGPLHDSAHAFAFFLLARFITLARLISIEKTNEHTAVSSGLDLAKIGGFCFGLGIVIELVQPAFGRSASFHDISYNFFGITSALIYEISKHKRTMIKCALRFAASALLLIALAVPAIGAYTLQQRQALFPILLDFNDDWQHRLYRQGGGANLSLTSNVKDWKNPSTSLKVDFVKTTYPGFNIPHVAANWQGYDALSFDVFSKLKHPQKLTMRIHDKAHTNAYNDRFNRTFSINPGLNRLQIYIDDIRNAPTARPMDIENIAAVGVFSAKPNEVFSLYFDNFKLKTIIEQTAF